MGGKALGNELAAVWDRFPMTSSAKLMLGRRDFMSRDENAGEGSGPLGMRWPRGIAASGGAILVACSGNNRALVWEAAP